LVIFHFFILCTAHRLMKTAAAPGRIVRFGHRAPRSPRATPEKRICIAPRAALERDGKGLRFAMSTWDAKDNIWWMEARDKAGLPFNAP
jgi:hypothetical protein